MERAIRVLVLEDMPADAELVEREICKTLKTCTFERVFRENDYREALAGFCPDIIISDYNMPGFDGLSALKIAKEKVPDIPFIMVTGTINEDTAVECMKAGAWDYVIKEFIKRLGPAVQNVLEQARLRLDRIRAQEALVENEERYRSVFEDNLAVMMMLDPDNGQIIDANTAAVNFYGYSYDQLKSMRISDINTLSPEKVELELQNALLRKRTHFLFQHRLANGTLRDVEVYCSRIQIREKKLLQTIVHDITDKIKLEQELIAAKEKAEENDRLKTAFLHNISHEIRTPLNAIVGFSNFLSDPGLTSEKRKEFVDIINLSSGQLLSIITDIITVATLEAGQERLNNRETDINNLLINVHEQFHFKSTHPGISLEYVTHLDDDEAIVFADSVKIIQVLTNLVGNALKFTKEGRVEIGCSLQQEKLQFSVSDTGIGMAPEFHHKIFERFRQADAAITREFGGTGLGLAISKAYVELMGGNIWVDSVPGKGSTFHFTIPYEPAKPKTEPLNKSEMNGLSNDNLGKTILVAEDEINNFLLIREMLRSGALKIIRAENGEQAVEACDQNPDINLVLMDIKMPVMDGIEAAKIIKSHRPDLPIIAITAYALDTDRRRIIESGFDEYLSKPMKKAELINKVNHFL